MTAPLDELYLTWLYSQHSRVSRTGGSPTFWKLSKRLFTKEFVWLILNDPNRAADGLLLREEFVEGKAVRRQMASETWMEQGCSVLELLIGLSRRLSFETDIPDAWWFWHLMGNLGLSVFNDVDYDEKCVEEIVDRFIFRNYKRNGEGGLFPLRRPQEDQRQIELWYQMHAYLMDGAWNR